MFVKELNKKKTSIYLFIPFVLGRSENSYAALWARLKGNKRQVELLLFLFSRTAQVREILESGAANKLNLLKG